MRTFAKDSPKLDRRRCFVTAAKMVLTTEQYQAVWDKVRELYPLAMQGVPEFPKSPRPKKD